MKVQLRKWLFSIVALASFIVFLSPTDAIGQITDFELYDLDECSVAITNNKVFITTPKKV